MTTVKLYQIDSLAISEGIYKLVRRIEAIAETISETLKTWSRRSADRRRLAQMNDRMLTDIGLTRGQVTFEANKFFWQS